MKGILITILIPILVAGCSRGEGVGAKPVKDNQGGQTKCSSYKVFCKRLVRPEGIWIAVETEVGDRGCLKKGF